MCEQNACVTNISYKIGYPVLKAYFRMLTSLHYTAICLLSIFKKHFLLKPDIRDVTYILNP